MAAPTPSQAHKLFPDPGSANYFDLPRDPKHIRQLPVAKQVPYEDLTLQDLVTKVKALNKMSFATGFAEKIASLPLDVQRGILAQLYAIGVSKQAASQQAVGVSNYGIPPSTSVPQSYIKQQFNLGSQPNQMGKRRIDPNQKESVGKSSIKPGQTFEQVSLREPLKDYMMKPEKNMGIDQLKPPDAFKGIC
jgi:hypothetical protein